MNSIKLIKDKIFEFFKTKPRTIVIIGLIGILLILLSDFINKDGGANTVEKSNSTSVSADEYGCNLEKRLGEQISEVIGGDVKVMVTLETGIEYVYASEAKNNESEIEDAAADNKQKLQKDKQSENNYILYKDENGNEVPLVVTEIMPSIKGVVVGCHNGDNTVISSTVKNLVTTALNISDDKVCVVGLDISR